MFRSAHIREATDQGSLSRTDCPNQATVTLHLGHSTLQNQDYHLKSCTLLLSTSMNSSTKPLSPKPQQTQSYSRCRTRLRRASAEFHPCLPELLVIFLGCQDHILLPMQLEDDKNPTRHEKNVFIARAAIEQPSPRAIRPIQ